MLRPQNDYINLKINKIKKILKFSNFKMRWPKSVEKVENGGRLGPLGQNLSPKPVCWIRPQSLWTLKPWRLNCQFGNGTGQMCWICYLHRYWSVATRWTPATKATAAAGLVATGRQHNSQAGCLETAALCDGRIVGCRDSALVFDLLRAEFPSCSARLCAVMTSKFCWVM